jgi:hypothetical protein
VLRGAPRDPRERRTPGWRWRAKGSFVSYGDGGSSAPKRTIASASHTATFLTRHSFRPHLRDDVLAEARALLTLEALASRFVNKQKQKRV